MQLTPLHDVTRIAGKSTNLKRKLDVITHNDYYYYSETGLMYKYM